MSTRTAWYCPLRAKARSFPVRSADRCAGGADPVRVLLQRGVVQALVEQVGVPHDSGQLVVEIVGHAACQLADGVHLVHLAEALGHAAEFRDVTADATHAHQGASLLDGEQGGADDADAVLPGQLLLEIHRLRGLDHLAEPLQVEVASLTRQDVLQARSAQSSARRHLHVSDAVVAQDVATVQVEKEDVIGRRCKQAAEACLALAKFLPGPSLRQGLRRIVRHALEKLDAARREPSRALVVELDEPVHRGAAAQGYEGHGFVPLPVAAVAGAALSVLFTRAGQEVGRAVAPEAAVRREEGDGRIEPPAQDVAAHAFQHRVSDAVAFHLALEVADAEPVLRLDEANRKARGLEVREVVAVPQADADGLAAGSFLQEDDQVARELGGFVVRVEETQEVHGRLALLLRQFALGDVLPDAGGSDDPAVGIPQDHVAPRDEPFPPVTRHDGIGVVRDDGPARDAVGEEAGHGVVARNEHREPVLPEHLFPRPARERQQVLVAEGDAALPVEPDGEHLDAFEQLAQAMLRVPQRVRRAGLVPLPPGTLVSPGGPDADHRAGEQEGHQDGAGPRPLPPAPRRPRRRCVGAR